MITWITDKVAIGEYLDACNREALEQNKIDCVLDLRVVDSLGEFLMLEQMGVHYFKLGIGREQGLEPLRIEIKNVASMIKLLAEKYNRILVHCTAGIDRSPAVVARYLSYEKYSFILGVSEAYKYIKNKRPQIKEHLEWIE